MALRGGILTAEQVDEVGKELGFDSATVTRLSESQFIMPGFVDTHTHAPQFVFTGTGYDERLLEWLQKYTFPVESRFANLDFARFNYERTVVCDDDDEHMPLST